MQEKTEKTIYSELRYNYEILDYIEYITPKGWHKAKRQIAFDKLNQLVKSYNDKMSLILFGSSSQNTCTVFSDIDVTIIDDNKSNYSFLELEKLNELMYFLEKNEYSYDMRLIDAKVPIIKGTHSSTGVKIDISYNRMNGYKDSFFIKHILEENNIIRQAIIILKILLRENDLNEPYSGGMGSYLLFHLVYFFDIKCKNSKDMKYHNVFSFLFLFFEYFGTKFYSHMYGISLNEENPGKIFYKYENYYMDDYHNICVEGINQRFVNIGGNCFNYEIIVELFKDSFHIMQNEKDKNTLSLLNKLGFPSIKSELFNS
jgi:non-canonical poly(A) RNA polymerase PAPD5/7